MNIAKLGYMLSVSLILTISSCSPQKRLARLLKAHPHLISTEATSDTAFVHTTDTLVRVRKDTVTTIDSLWLIRQRHVMDSIYQLRDSVVIDTLGVRTVIHRIDSGAFRIQQQITDSVLRVLYREMIVVDSLVQINDSLTSVIENTTTKTLHTKCTPWWVWVLITLCALVLLRYISGRAHSRLNNY